MTCPECGRTFTSRKALGGHASRTGHQVPPAQHGTNARYAAGCDCAACSAAHRDYQAEWRERNPGYLTEYMRTWRQRRRRQQRRGSTADIICDYLETYGAHTRDVLVSLIQDRHPDLATTTIERALARLVAEGAVERVEVPWREAGEYRLAS